MLLSYWVTFVFRHSGLGVKQYRYYDAQTCGFDFKGCVEDILVSDKTETKTYKVESFEILS